MLDRFVQLGYVVLNKALEPQMAAEIATEVRAMSTDVVDPPPRKRPGKVDEPVDAWVRVFGRHKEHYDPYRLQRPLTADLAEKLSTRMRRLWKAFYPSAETNDWRALKSLPGGKKQAPHLDYTFNSDFKHLDHVNVPAGLIVALEAGTHLYVYGWNRHCADPKDEKLIVLDAGDAILFRGELTGPDAILR